MEDITLSLPLYTLLYPLSLPLFILSLYPSLSSLYHNHTPITEVKPSSKWWRKARRDLLWSDHLKGLLIVNISPPPFPLLFSSLISSLLSPLPSPLSILPFTTLSSSLHSSLSTSLHYPILSHHLSSLHCPLLSPPHLFTPLSYLFILNLLVDIFLPTIL